eukprot:TRINITY_DN9243_c0_g1_i2.p1 TRINITY_DN9243_c0_g1~~TRINITY_DN9243_c0_g1_i2.p1  ORF type:complete len:125 (-),score=18.85 TRINITY_DN9243_c0_g1_i2:80-454(-)
MLKAKLLPDILSQADKDGTDTLLLLNSKGSLIATHGQHQDNPSVTGAILANVMQAYETASADLSSSALKFLYIECENFKVGLSPVAGLRLCIIADKDTPVGLLRKKSGQLTEYLTPPLSKLQPL